MADLFSLTCPTCGASLQIAGEKDHFQCAHCGNRYLLDRQVRELDEPARKHLQPAVTYTHTLGQRLRVADYDIRLHQALYQQVQEQVVFYIEVGYENCTSTPLQYRHDQWVAFDSEGHSFEPVKEFTHPHLYGSERIYLGMTRVLSPGMKLRGWLAFLLPGGMGCEHLQFAGGSPLKTVEFKF